MITENKGMFLTTPIPPGSSMNYCSHSCSYCLANPNKPDRSTDTKKTHNQPTGPEKSKTSRSRYPQNKHPTMAPNPADAPAKPNHKHPPETHPTLRKKDIPIYFQTRGGNGTDEAPKTLPKSAFYISITSHDDATSKKTEAGSPSPSERTELTKKLKNSGHEVATGTNPHMPNYRDAEKILQETRDYTDKYWINSIHLNNNQLKNIPTDRQKNLLKDELKYIKENNSLVKLYNLCIEYAVIPAGIYMPSLTNFYDIFDIYEKKIPTSYDFVKNIVQTKKEHTKIYYEEFEKFILERMSKEIQYFDSGYKVAIKRDYKLLKPKYKISEIINFHWNEWKISQGAPLHTQSFFPTKEKDNKGNYIYQYTYKPFFINN
jgi:DNA repair photolyase